MNKKGPLYYSSDVILFPLIFVMIIWIAFWVDLRFGLKFGKWGIYPQKLEGLKGVIFGPLIHGDLKHLFNNSIPLFVLSAALFYFYRNVRWKVLLWGTLLTGLGTWFIARPAFHIGASGVVYMLAAFLFFKGIFSKRYQLTALSLIVVFMYGGLLWYLFPVDPKISWEGHLSGFVVGFLFSLVFKHNVIEDKKYAWEREDFDPQEDEFLQQFDEDGNFVETKPQEDSEEKQDLNEPGITVRYIFKKRPNKKRDQ